MSASGDEDPIIAAVRRCLDAGGPLDLLKYASGVIDASRSGLTDLDERTVLATLIGGDGERQVLAYAIRVLLGIDDPAIGLDLPNGPDWLRSLDETEPIRGCELVDEAEESGILATEFVVVDRTVTVALIIDRVELVVDDVAVLPLPLDEVVENLHRDFSGRLIAERLAVDESTQRSRAALDRYQRDPEMNGTPSWPRLEPLVTYLVP